MDLFLTRKSITIPRTPSKFVKVAIMRGGLIGLRRLGQLHFQNRLIFRVMLMSWIIDPLKIIMDCRVDMVVSMMRLVGKSLLLDCLLIVAMKVRY